MHYKIVVSSSPCWKLHANHIASSLRWPSIFIVWATILNMDVINQDTAYLAYKKPSLMLRFKVQMWTCQNFRRFFIRSLHLGLDLKSLNSQQAIASFELFKWKVWFLIRHGVMFLKFGKFYQVIVWLQDIRCFHNLQSLTQD